MSERITDEGKGRERGWGRERLRMTQEKRGRGYELEEGSEDRVTKTTVKIKRRRKEESKKGRRGNQARFFFYIHHNLNHQN